MNGEPAPPRPAVGLSHRTWAAQLRRVARFICPPPWRVFAGLVLVTLAVHAVGLCLPRYKIWHHDPRYSLVPPALFVLMPVFAAGALSAAQGVHVRASGRWDELRLTRLPACILLSALMFSPLVVAALAALAAGALCRAMHTAIRWNSWGALGTPEPRHVVTVLVPVTAAVLSAAFAGALVGVVCGARHRDTWKAVSTATVCSLLLGLVVSTDSLAMAVHFDPHLFRGSLAHVDSAPPIHSGLVTFPWWHYLALRVRPGHATLAAWRAFWLTAAALNAVAAVFLWRACARAITQPTN